MTGDRKGATEGPGPAWWAMGLAAFGELTGWTVTPILAGLWIGRWLDGRYQVAPWGFLGCTGVALTVSCIGIVLVGSKYVARIDREATRDKDRVAGVEAPPMRDWDDKRHG